MSRPRKKPRQQRALATWTAILDAAAQLFGELGYTATTTNRIAERAGVSIGSLYQYFPNKDALLTALTERHLDEAGEVLHASFADLEDSQPDLEATISRLIDTTVALHARDPATHRLLFEQTPRAPEMIVRLRALEQGLAAAVAGQLQRLGVGGTLPQARALLFVQGIEAQVHGAVLAPPEATTTPALVAELKQLWVAALAGR